MDVPEILNVVAQMVQLLFKINCIFLLEHRFLLVATSYMDISKFQGPVVQSIVSFTSLLRGQLLTCFMTL